jgi:acyl-protein synthetase LuxE
MDRKFIRISEKVADFVSGADAGHSSELFNSLALEVFEYQYRSIRPYRRLCQHKDKTPETVQSWSEIPAVPADAFKQFTLFTGQPDQIAKTFKSSGTTDPRNSSKSHFSAAGLELMNTAVAVNAARMLFPDNRRTRILALAPSPEIAPHMIMVNGMSHMIRQFGAEGSRFCIGAQGLDVKSLLDELLQCEKDETPITLMGASFGFVHLFDQMEESGRRFALPDGSRLMDAGGYKGRSRELERTEFVERACASLGLPPERVVNLLGMTELASQIYDGTLARSIRGPVDGAAMGMKETPHWVRTRIVDPTSLESGDLGEIRDGRRPGLLRHLDLANVERPMVVQSDDIGLWRESGDGAGFEILRRAKGSEPRGCSLSVEEFSRLRSDSTLSALP